MPLCGGFGEAREADEEVQAVAQAVRAQVEDRLGHAAEVFEVKSYSTQVVAGLNFLMKVQVGQDGACAHVKAHLPLPHTGMPVQLMEVAHGSLDLNSPLVPF